MKYITNKKWWAAAGIRALKTLCQTAIALIGTATVIQEIDWVTVLSGSCLAAIISMLTSLGGLPEVGGAENEEEQEKNI